MEGRFDQQVGVVTGAASGIGRAIARRYVKEGGRAICGDIDTEGLAALEAELGDRVVTTRCDVTVEEDVASLTAASIQRFGRLDAMFNVAGGSRSALLMELSEQDWDFTVDLCLKGVFFGIKHAARLMVEGGRGGVIVSISSLNSRVPVFFGSPYSAAKAGVVSLGQSAALELAQHGIRVATVSPGLTDTPLVRPLLRMPAVETAMLDRIPLHRAARPEEIAAAVLFLAGADASYITGVNLFVDGGWEQTAYPDLQRAIAPPMAQ